MEYSFFKSSFPAMHQGAFYFYYFIFYYTMDEGHMKKQSGFRAFQILHLEALERSPTDCEEIYNRHLKTGPVLRL